MRESNKRIMIVLMIEENNREKRCSKRINERKEIFYYKK